MFYNPATTNSLIFNRSEGNFRKIEDMGKFLVSKNIIPQSFFNEIKNDFSYIKFLIEEEGIAVCSDFQTSVLFHLNNEERDEFHRIDFSLCLNEFIRLSKLLEKHMIGANHFNELNILIKRGKLDSSCLSTLLPFKDKITSLDFAIEINDYEFSCLESFTNIKFIIFKISNLWNENKEFEEEDAEKIDRENDRFFTSLGKLENVKNIEFGETIIRDNNNCFFSFFEKGEICRTVFFRLLSLSKEGWERILDLINRNRLVMSLIYSRSNFELKYLEKFSNIGINKIGNNIEFSFQQSISCESISSIDIRCLKYKCFSKHKNTHKVIGHGSIGKTYLAIYDDKKVVFRKRRCFGDRDVKFKYFEHSIKSIQSKIKEKKDFVQCIALDNINNKIYLVTEYIEGKNLLDFLKYNEQISKDRKLKLILMIAKSIQFLHKRGVIIIKLKPSNILIDEKGNPKIDLFATKDDDPLTMRIVGGYNRKFEAPEIIYKNNCPMSSSADLYSFALIIHLVITGMIPYGAYDINTFVFMNLLISGHIRPMPIPMDFGYEIKNLIEKYWNKNPRERGTIDEIILTLEKEIENRNQEYELLRMNNNDFTKFYCNNSNFILSDRMRKLGEILSKKGHNNYKIENYGFIENIFQELKKLNKHNKINISKVKIIIERCDNDIFFEQRIEKMMEFLLETKIPYTVFILDSVKRKSIPIERVCSTILEQCKSVSLWKEEIKQ